MANQSIYNSFERMWMHILNALNLKSDKSHIHTASEIGADPSGSANAALENANTYTDQRIANLINGAPTTLDTLGEIATAMDENADVVEALDTAIGSKANAAELKNHTDNTSNPHGVTYTQLGLTVETWTFTLEDGTTVTKNVVIG